ncbi:MULTISPECIES: hypothetical protein [Haloarcula]|uniref:Uncharacterized protein n=3 Tax=Haloarcula TaxID=2237 RepID=A0A830FWS1_HALAR|nr:MULTISPECIES: hypothetical protein [Haloarcula]EMA25190.1 hypothetical protein C443_03304 [Haloarcula argentinensis DSM 12282]MDS0256013.1 hypothetical protein [Haloarcula argentinensis]GGK82552.1 hypothetical protein GCM10009067_38560 [Haloarcula sebkhae]GGM50921.1 hypothetical protein GCM10009006_35090 [Haloarcula argentinensis]
MASKTSKSGQNGEQHPETESTEAQFPELTVQAEGTANRLRRVDESSQTDCLETVEVELVIEHEIDSLDEWKDLIDPTFRKNRRTGNKGAIIDGLLDRVEGHYRRQSSSKVEADWDLTVTGSSVAWRRLFMEFYQLRGEGYDRAGKTVIRLRQLVNADLAGTNAALAGLELVNQYDIDEPTDSFVSEVAESTNDD